MKYAAFQPKNRPAAVGSFICILILSVVSGLPAYGDWENDANARIEQIRKRNAQITIVDSLGNAVPGLNVQIDQIKHHFKFGTCIQYSKMSDAVYKNFILDHFEWAVCENDTKWGANEPSRDNVTYSNADTIYTWCHNNGIQMRGHCLFWEQVNGEFPSWVQSLPYAAYPASSELLDEVNERIDSAVAHFAGKFTDWDVDNEMLSDNFFTSRLGHAGIAHMFRRAKAVNPDGGVYMNEYSGNSFNGYDSGPYVTRANTLIAEGADIDGFGIQAHLEANTNFQPQNYYDNVLEPLAVFNKPILATEFDASHVNATTSADNIENFFRICFSHPNVEGIIMWGFMDGAMWRSNAGLVTSGGTLTQQGIRYEALLDEWTTTDSGVADENGQIGFRGFHGTYEITLSVPGEPVETCTIELEPGTGTEMFEIETALEPPEPDEIPPAAPTGLSATAGSGVVWLGWDANTEIDLDGYNVYRSTVPGSNYTQVAELLENPAYTDYDVSNGTTYYYVVTAQDFSGNESDNSNEADAAPELGTGQNPYPGPQAHAIPGRIEAENYDTGGEGIAFHDSDAQNEGGDYRGDGVDVEACGDAGGGYNVGWIQNGEWLEYTVDVAASGTYDLELRVASDSGGGDLHIEFDGHDVTGSLSFAPTGGWQNYITIGANDVYLTKGLHIMRIVMDATYFNINWLNFTGGPDIYGDFTGDFQVNIDDLPGFVSIWLDNDCGPLDLNEDCLINLYEFAAMARNWE